MPGFYKIEYQGASGIGAGAMALANGKVAGMDVGGGIYKGTYTDNGSTTEGTAVLYFEAGGQLVTGASVPAGYEIPIQFSFPTNSQKHNIGVTVSGHNVVVLLTKIGEL